jgi:hypothetical protein
VDWSSTTLNGDDARDVGFAYLIGWAGNDPTAAPDLKVRLGWSQNVWIILNRRPDGSSQVAMLEKPIAAKERGESEKLRRFNLSVQETSAFFKEFDDCALGFHVSQVGGYDGRGICFERRRDGRTISYSGNASFSSQDAEMAQVVDRLVMAHGGYAYLDAKRWQ